jgi:3'-phosphoadenosine 5'-phosphosulfate sulfotransferase (PAPS reductase)/FAD synthetase
VRLLLSIREGGPKIEWLKPERDFYELALHKHRFPSAKARFCTEHLKIIPGIAWCNARLAEGHTLLSHSGVRAGESLKRSTLPERDMNGMLLVEEYRPLLRWTIEDVYAIHKEHGVPLNKLYAAGAKRVGCFPCIMSRKAEVRNIALNFPDRIAIIAHYEGEFMRRYGRYSSFFASKTVPLRFRKTEFKKADGTIELVASIQNVVEWSMTGKRAKGHYTDDETLFDGSCESGFCE